MTDPTEDIPPDCPLRGAHRDFEFRAFRVGMTLTAAIRAVVEFTDEFHRPLQRMKAAVAVVTDVHRATANTTIAVDDVQFPLSKIRILGPTVRHRANLHAMTRSIWWASMVEFTKRQPHILALWRTVELITLWQQLASADAVAAGEAMRRLTAFPQQSAALLRDKLTPVAAVPKEKIAKLVDDLDAAQPKVRANATTELEKMAELAEPALRACLTAMPTLEQRIAAKNC